MKRNPKSLFKVTTLVAFSAMSLPALAADPASKTEPAEAAAAKQSLLGRGDLHGAKKASDLIGMTVRNNQNETIGKIDDLIVDFAAGRVVAVIVASGDYLDLKDEFSAVLPSALRFTADRESLQLDADKTRLAAAPHFNASKWPDFTQPAYAAAITSAYQQPNVAPAAVEPDNTARNKNDKGPTPVDQGENKPDITTSAQIRKELIAMDALSLTAKNVKIITNAGKVTLRGPVTTAAEKKAIGEIAGRIANREHVDNQLEVESAR